MAAPADLDDAARFALRALIDETDLWSGAWQRDSVVALRHGEPSCGDPAATHFYDGNLLS